MAKNLFHVVVERDEDGWLVGSVPELPGCHTQARSMNQLERRIREAISAYLGAGRRPRRGPAFVGVQTVEV